MSATASNTPTVSPTPSLSPTLSPTFTPSPSNTPFAPLSADISIYNSAGELVWASSTPISIYQLPVGLDPIRPTVMPDDGQAGAVALLGPGYVFTWSGTGNAGQPLDSGSYTVSVRTKDSFGARTTFSTTLTVIRTQAGVRVSIYNSAGELVRQAQAGGSTVGALRLDKEGLSAGAGPGEGVEIRWGAGPTEAYVWDGTDGQGRAVTGGTYTVQVTRLEAGKPGQTYAASVAVLPDPGQPYASAAAVPNPVRAQSGAAVFVALEARAAGTRAWGRVYNLAGELVGTMKEAPGGLVWMLERGSASGVYLLRVEAQDGLGRHKGDTLKLCVLN